MSSLVGFPAGLLLHLLLVFAGRFFLSPELVVYPYFVSRGLLPYRQLIDQHFPLVFFGPLNLGQLGLTTPTAALITFLAVIFTIDLIAYRVLKYRPLVFFAFILAQIVLGGATFWLDSFLLLFLVVFLASPRSSWALLAASLAVGIRPTLLPLVFVWLLVFSAPIRPRHLLLLTFPLLEAFWLTTNRLWPEFLLLFDFNLQSYAIQAAQAASPRQLLTLALVFAPLLTSRTKLLLLFPAALLAYPRFELYHLLPLSALFLTLKSAPRLWLVLLLLVAFRQFSFSPTNFYYPPQLYRQAAQLSNIYDLSSGVYFFGGPDQLYQLTKSLPPGGYYLPSLPWYLSQPTFVTRQLRALSSHPQALVVVNGASRLNGVSLLDYGQPIWNYLLQNYQPIGQIDNLIIYENRP